MDFLIGLVNQSWFLPVLVGAFALYLLVLSVVLSVWSARDISRRTTARVARLGAPAFVFAFGLVGFLVYVALRPRRTLEERAEELRERALLARAVSRAACPSCQAEVDTDFASCPFCKVDFAPVCTSCGGLMQLRWKRCGYCGVAVPSSVGQQTYVTPRPLDLDLLEERAAQPIPSRPTKELPRKKDVARPVAVARPAATSVSLPPINATAQKLRKPEPEPPLGNLAITLQRILAIKR